MPVDQTVAHTRLIPVASGQTEKISLRLDFLDGIRGLAALYVLLFHIRLNANFDNLPHWFQVLQSPISYGHYAVCVFIVLSGFCLMLPIARSAQGELRGGMVGFAKRRARRILPAYYAAFLVSFAWVIAYEGFKLKTGHANSFALNVSPGNLSTHLFLVFNLFPSYSGATNGAFWSVASEWQIYFVFALILLPIWRKLGTLATVAAAIALGIAPHYLLPPGALLDALNGACSWFIGLFAIGMLGAMIRFRYAATSLLRRHSIPWGTFCIALTAVLFMLTKIYQPVDNPWAPELILHFTWITDSICGLTTLCLIMFCCQNLDISKEDLPNSPLSQQKERLRSTILRLLESQFGRKLGSFSYSLYLIHLPILSALLYVVSHIPVSPLVQALLMWGCGTSLSLCLAWLFSLKFERPFTSQSKAKVGS